jgi:hypothetical protein
MRDFLQLENGDLDLSGGDITMTDATRQHQRDIILTRPGALKHVPARGVGVEDYFNDESPEDMLRKTRQELLKDGQTVRSIKMSNGNIEINAYYEADFIS